MPNEKKSNGPASTPASEVTEVEKTQSNVPAKKGGDLPNVLEGVSKASGMLDGHSHVSIAVRVSADNKESALVIPDISKDKDKTVYLTKPISIKLEYLNAFFADKKIEPPDFLKKLAAELIISCNAFYYVSEANPPKEESQKPLLMMFSINFKDAGLIETLTGDKALGKLFDITGASVRIFRCPEPSFAVLEEYVRSLSE